MKRSALSPEKDTLLLYGFQNHHMHFPMQICELSIGLLNGKSKNPACFRHPSCRDTSSLAVLPSHGSRDLIQNTRGSHDSPPKSIRGTTLHSSRSSNGQLSGHNPESVEHRNGRIKNHPNSNAKSGTEVARSYSFSRELATQKGPAQNQGNCGLCMVSGTCPCTSNFHV